MAKPPVPVNPTTAVATELARYRFASHLGLFSGSAISTSLMQSQIARVARSIAEERNAGRGSSAAPAASDTAITGLLSTQVSNYAALNPAELVPLDVETSTTLDPRLQLALINRRSGKLGLMTASTAGDEVAVVARVENTAAWEAIADVVVGATLGQTANND